MIIQGEPLPEGLCLKYPDGQIVPILGVVMRKGENSLADSLRRLAEEAGAIVVFSATPENTG